MTKNTLYSLLAGALCRAPALLAGDYTSLWLTAKFATGLGGARDTYTDNNGITQEVRRSRVVGIAREMYYNGSFEQGRRIDFEELEFIDALFSPGITDDFLGSIDKVYITDLGNGNLRFVVMNYTDMASFTKYFDKIPGANKIGLRMLDSYERGDHYIDAGGRIRQTYIWTEPKRK